MSDQTERERKYAEAIWGAANTYAAAPTYAAARAVITVADQEQAELRAEVDRLRRAYGRLRFEKIDAEARVRELEAALQQSRDDHQGAVEKLRAVEALADEWRADYPGPGAAWVGSPDEWWRELRAALASPVESVVEDAK